MIEEEATVTSTKEETDKKCPSCGGTMDFDPATGGLSCPYCGFVQEITLKPEEMQSAQELVFSDAERTENCNWGTKIKTVICKSCGAESVYDSLQVSGECPYCGSNQVMEVADVNTMAPGGVVKFSVTVKEAAERFKQWLKKQLFCPKAAKVSAKPDKIHGVYLPYWTFDTDTVSQYTARYGIDHKHVDKDGHTHTTTTWHATSGIYSLSFDDQLVLATERHDTSLLSGVEPFKTGENVAYKPEYMAGFASERYSVGLKEGWERARRAITGILDGKISDDIRHNHRADRVDQLRFSTMYNNITYKYLMLPVWMSSFKYKNKVYNFMVNGQTGKVSGKAPVSPFRVAIAIFILLVIVVGVIYLSQYSH